MAAPPSRAHPPLVEHCVELFSPLGRVRTTRMFGGWGFYLDDVFFALIAFERLFLKVSDQTRPLFEAAGTEPFIYTSNRATGERQLLTSYQSAPAEAMDSPALMEPWARRALQAAIESRKPRAPRKAQAARAAVKPRAAPKRAASSASKPSPATAKKAPRRG